MAEISVTARKKGPWLTFEWTGVTESDTFEEIYLSTNVSDMFIEVEGTFGTGGDVGLTGWVVTEAASSSVVDPGGTTIAITADGSSPIRDAWAHMRPAFNAGTGVTVDVRIYAKVAK